MTGLSGRFRSEPVPATGFSIGVSRLQAALQHVGSQIVSGAAARGPVVVLVMDRERIADYQRMVARLRAAKIRAELYLGSAGMKAQMKYADRRRAPCVVIQGSQERERGEVQIKDLVAGAERVATDAIGTSNAEYRAARVAPGLGRRRKACGRGPQDPRLSRHLAFAARSSRIFDDPGTLTPAGC